MCFEMPAYEATEHPTNYLMSASEKWDLYKSLLDGDKLVLEKQHVFEAVAKLPLAYQGVVKEKLTWDLDLWLYERVKATL